MVEGSLRFLLIKNPINQATTACIHINEIGLSKMTD